MGSIRASERQSAWRRAQSKKDSEQYAVGRMQQITDYGQQDYEERKDTSPCGIALRANNSTSVGSVFHGDTNAAPTRIFHGAGRKGAKGAKF